MEKRHLSLITSEEMQDILKYNLLFDALERGFALFSQSSCGQEASAGFIDQPVRTCVTIPSKGFFGCMPVYIEAEDLLVSKLVTAFPKNKDIPSHNAIVAVFDASCGVPRALLDGDIITTRRTAAASAVATKHLVNGEPKVLAILGCGVQGTSHYDALTAMFQLEKVKVWNHRPERAIEFAKSDHCCHNTEACTNVEEAVKDADVIVTVTSSSTPILMAEWIKPGAHINAVGACRPDWAEIDANLMRSAVVYVDSLEAAMKESGDIILSKADVFAEIGEVINGSKPGLKKKTTVFKSLGMAVEDAVAAKIVLDALGL